jgi:hypothetical protein
MALTDTPSLPSAQTLRQKTLVAALNATMLYVLAYLTADTLYRAATVATAVQLRIPVTWQLGQLWFRLADADWWRSAVVAVYAAGPLACLLLTLLAGAWFWQRARLRRGLLKQYLMWLVLHGLNAFFGAMVADTFTRSGFWYVPTWLIMAGPVLTGFIAFFCALILAAVGFFAAPLFLQSHDSRSLMRYEERRRLLLATLFVPWLAGSLILAALRLPELSTNEQLHFATMLLAIGPLAMACTNELFEFTVPVPQKTRAAWGLVVLVLLLAVGLRLVLGHGLRFG